MLVYLAFYIFAVLVKHIISKSTENVRNIKIMGPVPFGLFKNSVTRVGFN